ncbi:ABC transporter ATP-binding protein [Cellulomonas sp. ES6]|uniref:ABC transporter ATP-binding protein n=1 Tax=Cellulomonas sp. ES6 TaxID=3039384 RepID=UPI0024B840C2|nr:ABC transporter ATP-binding protein [Cellulomonas sp. ES6]WHP19289.1 ABC transporter ATP-binding protein [Cellulomonas sp. ES6]
MARSGSRSVSRSAGTGRFVSKATVARWPGKTTTERVGSGTSNGRAVARSASTGRFVTGATAKRNPGGTITQQV